MADKRMLSKQILDSDAFLDLTLTQQALYFHICVRCDDEGFHNSPKKMCRMIGCSDKELDALCDKGFLIRFQSGVVVVTHWLIHNTIQKDRFHRTAYTDERKLLQVADNKLYTLDTSCIQDVSKPIPEYRLDLDIDKNNKDIVEKESSTADIKRIIDHLNLKTGSNYRANNKTTVKLLKGILKDYTVKDCMDVIDKKCREWITDEKMSQYLRPQTLFGSKFESYLNAPLSTSKNRIDVPEYYTKLKQGILPQETEPADNLLQEIESMKEKMHGKN